MKTNLVKESLNEYINREEDTWADSQIDNWRKDKMAVEGDTLGLSTEITDLEEWLLENGRDWHIRNYEMMVETAEEEFGTDDKREWPVEVLNDFKTWLSETKDIITRELKNID